MACSCAPIFQRRRSAGLVSDLLNHFLAQEGDWLRAQLLRRRPVIGFPSTTWSRAVPYCGRQNQRAEGGEEGNNG